MANIADQSDRFLKFQVQPRPLSYEEPPFPALYWPFPVNGPQCTYLYDAEPMWRFTLYWTLIMVGGVHLVASAYACAIQYRNWKLIWIAPLVYAVLGTVEALIAGNVVGGLYVAYDASCSEWCVLIEFLQGGCRVHRGLLPNVYLDTIHMGHHQRTGTDIIVFCNTRWTLAREHRDSNCIAA